MTSPDVEQVQVVYDADAGCPGRAKFVEEIMARTRKIAVAEAAHAKRTFVVTVRATDDGFSGKLEIQAGEPPATTREINGQSCAAVVSAVALVAALAVDPESLRGDALGKAPAPRDEKPPPPATKSPAIAPADTPSPPSRPAPHDSRDWQWAVGVKAEGNSVIAPQLSFGGGAFLELAPRYDDAPALIASAGVEALRVGAHYALSGSVDKAPGTAHFDWAALGFEGCLFRARWGSAEIDTCAALDVGFLRGHGEGVAAPQTLVQPKDPTRLWLSVGPLLRVKWTFFRSWFLDASGSLPIPLRRDTFVFDQPAPSQSQVFYEAPKVGAAAGIGIGYRFDDRANDRRP